MRWLVVDRIVDCDPGKTAVGIKCFSRSDPIFIDHFPGFPIVPGVLQVEMIAQLGGKCIACATPEILPVLGSIKRAKFYHNITPGDQCNIHVTIEKVTSSYAIAEGYITVGDKKVSAAEVLYGFVPRANLTGNEFDAVVMEWRARNKK